MSLLLKKKLLTFFSENTYELDIVLTRTVNILSETSKDEFLGCLL